MASWRHFGFQFTPFSTNPLEPVETGPDAHVLFVGRDKELQQLVDRVEDEDTGSRSVIEGPLGSGKTSLLTQAKVRLSKATRNRDPYLVPVEHVRLKTNTTFDDLGYQIVQHVLATVRLPSFPHKLDKKGPLAQAIRLFEGGKDRQGGASIAGFGLQGGAQTSPAGVARRVDWHAMLRGLAEDVVSLDYEGILVHINNLETLIEQDPDLLKRLLHDARDLFQTPACHFVLVAPPGFTTNILGAVDAARTIFPATPIPIPLLSQSDFGGVVEKRYDHAKADEKYVRPVDTKVAQELYRLTGGSLRATFQVIQEWAQRLDAVQIRTANSVDELVQLLKPPYQAQVQALPHREQATLEAAVRLGDPFRQRGLVKLLGKKQPNVSEVMGNLEEKGFLLFERQDGASRWYRLDQRALIAYWGRLRGPGGETGESEPA